MTNDVAHPSKTPALRGERVKLRSPLDRDAKDRVAFGNTSDADRPAALHSPPITPEAALNWLVRLASHPHAWVIDYGAPIGEIRLDSLSRAHQHATLSVEIFYPHLRRRGFATEACRLVLRHAFSELKLHRVAARAVDIGAVRLFEKCGFTHEGREREALHLDGRWNDDRIMGLLDAEFRRPH